jgi:hypothetical protein
MKDKKNVSSLASMSATTPRPQMSDVSLSRHKLTSTAIHIMALDGIFNANSLFTLALFLGLSWNPTNDPSSTLVGGACVAGSTIAEDLVTFHVYSFSSFLFSSLIALALKQAIKISKRGSEVRNIGGGGEVLSVTMGHLNTATLRVGILVSAFGSVFGCGFLMMALVDLVQIKMGVLGCRSWDTLAAIGPLVILVPLALFIYVFLVLYAFTR